MKRVLLTISYDGTAYHGWQVQPNGVTVQSVLSEACEKVFGTKFSLTGCSRTDAGVHAKEFCLHIDCDETLPEKAFVNGLNSALPNDISVNKCIIVPNDFHARYSAKGKQYVYNIYNSNLPDPFLSRYSWQVDYKLDLEKINEFLNLIVGEHDFIAFSSSGRSVDNTIRTITETKAEITDDFIKITVSANGFLYNMVRIIVGTAVEYSQGRVTAEDVLDALRTGKRDKLGITAPPQGLFLNKVIY